MQQEIINDQASQQQEVVSQKKETNNAKNHSTIQAKGFRGQPLQPVQTKQKKKPPIQAKGFGGQPLQPIQTKQKKKSPIQAKGFGGQPLQPIQRKSNSGGLPYQLQSNMESMSGVDLSDVKVHRNSDKPVQLQAHAYAQGSDIHLAPGQEKHLPHEAWHVVQQKQGRVQATTQLKSDQGQVGVNDSPVLEHEADVMGAKATQGQPSSDTPVQKKSTSNTVQMKNAVVQRVATSGGDWNTPTYDLRRDKNPHGTVYNANVGVRGLDIKLTFKPNADTDAEAIGIVQTAQSVSKGNHPFIDGNASRESRALSSGTEKGTMIDRADGKNNPIYGSKHMAAGKGLEDTPLDNNPTANPTSVGLGGNHNATYQLGYHYTQNSQLKEQEAQLYDAPTLGDVSTDSKQVFESTAIATKGNQKGTYYGSVRWGWETDGTGNFTKIPLTVVSQGVPSSTFIKAAKVWNGAKDSTGADTIDLPIPEVQVTQENDQKLYPAYWDDAHIKLPQGTRIKVSGWYFGYTYAEVLDGPHTGEKGYIENSNYEKE